jgi:Zn-finger nucleic acid-binding protein
MCGAPAVDNSPNCLHCGARLAKVACPSCFGMIFEGSKFCPHCGAEITRTEVPNAPFLPCPKCQSNMEALLLGATPVSECQTCNGLWVDVSTFQQICVDREKQSAVLGMAAQIFPAGQMPLETKYHYVPCPVCRELMARVNFAHCSGIVVDVCRQHGTWFERDELQNIVNFIRSGGLEKCRQKEKEELDDARRRLMAARRAAAFDSSDNRPRYHAASGLLDIDLFEIAGSLLEMFLHH